MDKEKIQEFLNQDIAFGNRKLKNKAFLIAMAVIVLALVLVCIKSESYIGGVSHAAIAYTDDENGNLVRTYSDARGTRVKKLGKSIDHDGMKLELVETESGTYYIDASALTSRNNVVQEKEVYVRTPVTVYANEDGPQIASYMAKGSKLAVLDYDELQENGYIHKYKVSYTDSTGNSGEGFIYGKYVEGTQEEADANYNSNGEFDKAKKAKYSFNLYGGKATNLDYYPYEKTPIDGKEFCENARTMYLNTYAAVHPEDYLDVVKKSGCNAVCIDIKDGSLTYKSEVAKEVSSHAYKEGYVSAEEFQKSVKAYKDTGVYTIGRIVVFNDTRYAKDHPEDCIKAPSMTKGWPSAYSRKVWEYNVRLAQEAVELCGFDEIQFDYVRFPESSYELSKSGKANFRNKYKEDKCQAIQNFCFYAADQLREVGAYISVDVFGESTYGYVTAYGQYWPALSNIVDALSAMPYTDHTGGEGAWTRPYQTVYNWAKTCARSQEHLSNPAKARTWITGYDTPYWNPTIDCNEKYLKKQIKGLTDAGLDGGFIPWNVISNLEKYNSYINIWK